MILMNVTNRNKHLTQYWYLSLYSSILVINHILRSKYKHNPQSLIRMLEMSWWLANLL